MATYIPNAAGRALDESTGRLLEVMMQKMRMDQQESQFQRTQTQQQSQFDETMDMRARTQALEMAQFFAPFNIGKPIAESPIMSSAMGQLFPEFDAQDWANPEGLGGITLGDETFSQYLDQRRQEVFEAMPPEEQKRHLERMNQREITGVQGPTEALDVQDMQFSAARDMLDNPRNLARVAEITLGLPEKIDVTVFGKRYQWESVDQARIALALMNLAMQPGSGPTSRETIDKMAEDLQALARDKKFGIPLQMARTIVETVHSEPPEGMTRQEMVDQLAADLGPNGAAALDIYVRGTRLVPPMLENLEQNAPEIFQYGQLRGLASMDLEDGGFGMSAEEAATYTPRVANALRAAGWVGPEHGVAAPGFGIWPGWRLGEVLGPSDEDQSMRSPTDATEMRAGMVADTKAYANNEISMSELVKKWGRTAALAIAQDARALKEED